MSNNAALGSLVIELGASLATLQSDFTRASALTDRAVADINLKINSIGSGSNFNGLSAKVQGLTADFNSLRNVIVSIAGIDLSIGGLEKIAGLADDYQNVSNRIRTTVADSQQLAAVTQQVFAIAQETGTALDATAKTYQRLEQVIEGTGKSQLEAQQQAIALTKELNEEIIVSGVSSAEASRAVMDLVHGLAGGELQARQFNQIMRQFPDLAKQIAQGLGVSSTQLEKMVHAGLPAVDVLRALANQSDAIDARFKDLPVTFARAWTQLTNAVEKYIGEASQASAVSDAVKSSIIGIANNIGIVAVGAEAVGVAMAAWLGGKGLQAISGIVSLLGDMATAQGVYKTAAIASAEADIASAAASQKAAAATILHVDAANDLRIAELAELQAKQESIIAEQALLTTRQRQLPVGIDVVAEEQRLLASRVELAAATTRITTLEGEMAASQVRATLAETAETAATIELAAAKQRLVVAQSEATAATGLFARAGAGLFAAIGGWPTLILAAAAAVGYLMLRETDAQKAAEQFAKVADDVARAHGAMTPALEKTAEAAYNEAKAMAEAAQANANFAAVNFAAVADQGGEAAMLMGRDMGIAQGEAVLLTQRMNDLAGAILKAKLAAAGKSLYDAIFPDLRSALAQIDALSDGIDKQTAKFQEQAATYGKGHAAIVQYTMDQQIAKLTLGQSEEATVKITAAIKDKYAADLKAAQALDAVTAATKAQNKELTAQQRALKDYQTDVGKLVDIEEQLASGLGGPYLAALRTYEKEIDLTAKTWGDAVAAGVATDDLLNRLSDDQEHAREQWQRTNEQIQAQHDQFAKLNEELELQETLLQTLPQNQAAVAAGLNAYNSALRAGVDLYGKAIPLGRDIKDVLNEQLPAWEQEKQAVDDASAAVKRNNDVLGQWKDIAVQGFDAVGGSIAQFATGGIKTFSDFGKSLLDDTKQFVAAIIQELLKLEVFNGIINSLFGLSGSSALPTFANLAAGGAGGGGMLGGLFSSATSAAGSGAATSGFSLLSPSTWLTAGQNLFSGFSSGLSNLWSGTPGASGSSFLGGPSYYSDANGFMQGTAYAPSTLGSVIGIGGGILAGVGEYKAAGGGVAGLAGGAAYGLGTLTASGAIGGVLSGAGAAAGASGALGSIGLGAIPVVGWIALAAMAVNMLTGGGLFGTSAKPIGSETNLSVGQNGASVSQAVDEKGKKALFEGSYWKTVDVKVDQQTQDAFATYFASVSKVATQEAAQFGEQTATIVSGSFRETFDKAGKMLTETSTVLGQKYTEDAQAFETRVMARTILANLDDASSEANSIANQWDATAQKLMDGAQFLAQAESDIANGHALAQGDTLMALTAFVQGMQQQDETLLQTYARLSNETSDVAGILANLGMHTDLTGEALVKFSDDMVTAAGGLDNLNKLWNDYYNDFFSASERGAIELKNLQVSVQTAFAAIGEDPGVSMAQFRTDFEAKLPTLSAADVVKWLQAGELLNQLNQTLGQTADSANSALQSYDAFIGQFKAALNPLTDFETAIQGLGVTLAANIDKANALAVAAGNAGASTDDLATILQATVVQGAAALQKLESDTQALAGKLFGTSVDALKSKLADIQAKLQGGDLETQALLGPQAALLQKQIDAANAQQQAAANFNDAQALLGNLGQIGAIDGESLADLAKRENIPLDKLASYLNTDATGLQKLYDSFEATDKAQLEIAGNTKYTNELLADIIAQEQGRALPYTPEDLAAAATGSNKSTPGHGSTPPVSAGGGPISDDTHAVVTAIRENTEAVHLLRTKIDISNVELVSQTKIMRAAPNDSNRNTAGSNTPVRSWR